MREPYFLLKARDTEYKPKPGGGTSKPPIVPVTPEYRAALVERARSTLGDVKDSPLAAYGIPFTFELRAQALAKSNRPYKFLSSIDLSPVAAVSRGILVARATAGSVEGFVDAVESRRSKDDVYAISTIGDVGIWDPVRDAVDLDGRASVAELIEEARRVHRVLRLELFPWLDPERVRLKDGEPFKDYLDELGFGVRSILGNKSRMTVYVEVGGEASTQSLAKLVGVRRIDLAPSYRTPIPVRTQGFREIPGKRVPPLGSPVGDEPTVGVLDSGVSAASLAPWTLRSWRYDRNAELDTNHGSFVAGLVVASRLLNDNHDAFGNDSACVYDAQVMSAGDIGEDLLIERIREVLQQSGADGPRVWNCSFNLTGRTARESYSPFAQEMDSLARDYHLLFVQSAGNFNALRWVWPPDGSAGEADMILPPADAVDTLAVGALSHKGGLAPAGAPASYSRRGPSFGGQQKPDVVHYAGDVAADGSLSGFGVTSIAADGSLVESVGTSFSTPLVSSIAANVWRHLDGGDAVTGVESPLVRAVVVHAATLQDQPIDPDFRRYYGAGVPSSAVEALSDEPYRFTTIHRVDLKSGVNWEKRPFPIPDCLIDDRGKIAGVVTVTLAYQPVIDAAYGDESVRTAVEFGFGHYVPTTSGGEKFNGELGGSHKWEADLIERGKWSPTTSYRKRWSRGVAAQGDWALQLRLTARDSSIEPLTQRAWAVVTLEALDRSLPVRQRGAAAIVALKYPHSLVVPAARVRIDRGV